MSTRDPVLQHLPLSRARRARNSSAWPLPSATCRLLRPESASSAFPDPSTETQQNSALKSLLTNTHHEIMNLHAARTGSVGRGSVAADGNQRHQGGWKNDKRSSKPAVYRLLSLVLLRLPMTRARVSSMSKNNSSFFFESTFSVLCEFRFLMPNIHRRVAYIRFCRHGRD